MTTRNRLMSLMAGTALVSAACISPASAQSLEELQKMVQALQKQVTSLQEAVEAQQKTAVVVSKAEPAMGLKTTDGKFEMNMRGRLFTDFSWINDGDNTMDVKGTEFRAARLGIEGKAWKDVKYKFEIDFAGDEVTIKDAYMQWNGDSFSTIFGQFKTPNSLEEQTSSRHITFMERASLTDAFSLARMLGVGVAAGDKTWTAKAGVFRGSASSDDEDEGLVFAGRATYGGKMNNGVWMLGGSFRHRNNGDGQSDLRYRQRPHQHLSDRFIATPRVSDQDTLYALEGAVQAGSFHVGAEWAMVDADYTSMMGSHSSGKMYGYYVEAGWFLTGESKTLKLDKATWDRPKVNKPVYEGGMGAWQIAARYDVIDLTGYGLYGGEQDTFVIGVNWYLNRHSRIMLNYNHSSIDKAWNVAANGADGENSVDGFGMRFQVDW